MSRIRSRIRWRVEDLLAAGFALAFAAVAAARARVVSRPFDAQDFWDVSYFLAPLALLCFIESARYAFRTVGDDARGPLGRIAAVARDWLPFLFFSLSYEAFRLSLVAGLLPKDRDGELLRLDRALFGETPAVTLDRFVSPAATDVLTVAYALHVLLPPALALLFYAKERALFRRFLLTVQVAGLLGSIGYVLVPAVGPGVYVPQSFGRALEGVLYGPALRFVDAMRAPRDVFPSLHVAISTIVLVFAWKRGPRLFFWLLVPVVLNWVSTLYLRYHYAVDVVAGWLVAAISCDLSRRLLALEQRR